MDFKEKPPPVTESGILDPLRAPTMWAVSDDDQDPPASVSSPSAAAFDVCHVGVVLRVVLGMQLILLLATLFGASHWLGWLNQWALANAEALPAVLAWLVAVCAARRWLGRQRRVVQWWVVAHSMVLVLPGSPWYCTTSLLVPLFGFHLSTYSTVHVIIVTTNLRLATCTRGQVQKTFRTLVHV